jgi:hypothetical protein
MSPLAWVGLIDDRDRVGAVRRGAVRAGEKRIDGPGIGLDRGVVEMPADHAQHRRGREREEARVREPAVEDDLAAGGRGTRGSPATRGTDLMGTTPTAGRVAPPVGQGLIATKLTRPPLRTGHIARQRLMDALTASERLARY